MNGLMKKVGIKIVLGRVSVERTKLNERTLWQIPSCAGSSMLLNGFLALLSKACVRS